MTVKLLAAPDVTELGSPVTASNDAPAGWTTIPDSLPVMVDVVLSVAVKYCMPAVSSVAENVCTPLSLPVPVVNV